ACSGLGSSTVGVRVGQDSFQSCQANAVRFPTSRWTRFGLLAAYDFRNPLDPDSVEQGQE
ncbi:MAG: hypothetical protein AB7T05_08200, partial [Fimbriimonadaceae bacterium]